MSLPFPVSVERRIYAAEAENDDIYEAPESTMQAGEQAQGETP